ncbi:tRNA (adenosine(37)-N6)-threonylcarbamoyltransferase complex ATPase subunit type 1 TsaE [Algibacter pectinivorans]|uniref:tRNA threonylcarbamoyladenosine biosynthesis protein TsaE n=1 Tax=Algibacter pectinivorans TaxID=870482 RepID=A0A1I1PQ56_9FLAO|nr:tRNA (adenosine(37)-N6)-threonylcarbamoyltransferase complex ATPase subunit type 1 TsaE [Algibacter pectinivorans]SFD08130.1 tRNA threonylcarbamoyladenosine biosynthesis protein TsaE [Algibacter pectinivorans]
MEIFYGLDDVEQVARQIIKNSNSKTLLFYGDMGVGKTTLIKSIVESLGSNNEVSSPTFSIVNEYNLSEGKIFHFDLYRINDVEETYNFGIEDYLDSDFWKLVEWPEIIESLLIETFTKIEIKLKKNNKRYLSLKNVN